MTLVTKTVRFDAAHVLTNHDGLCKNLHGHTYRVEICAGGDLPAASTDMVVDFKEIKRIANDIIVARFDHAFIYNTASAGECEIAAVVERLGMKTVALPFRSTAENLASLFFRDLKPYLAGLIAVKVWETPDSSAEFRA